MKKRVYIIAAALLVAAAVIGCIAFSVSTSKNEVIGQVTLCIRCDTIVGKSDTKDVPSNGIILAPTAVDIKKGDTVYDVFVETAKAHKIHFEKDGSDDTAYIIGIQHLYAADYGDLSGWICYVNGESLSVGCSKYELSPDDVIEWHYTCDMGMDIK